MIFLVVGQRGTGKSELARRFAPGPVIDLDERILERTGRAPSAWIETEGEPRFREIEREALRELLEMKFPEPPWIVLGAGFELDEFDVGGAEVEVIHWRRITDAWGRIFTDRPRLNRNVDPLTEYLERYPAREARFYRHATWTLEWPEGEHLNTISQARALLAAATTTRTSATSSASSTRPPPVPAHSGIYTLRATDRARADVILERFTRFGFHAFELRTDLLTDDDLAFWIDCLPAERLLFAERRETPALPRFAAGRTFFETDWALEWGAPPAGYSTWSNHGGGLESFPTPPEGVRLKWSPLIENFAELERGYLWQQADPVRRSFLPRSTDGRWAWFRLWMKDRQRLNFVRELENAEAPDQPALLEFISHVHGENFAAILGDPVTHSWTPGEQAAFFAARAMPVLRIRIAEDEWDEAFPVLTRLGLRAAAVTSPLKHHAFTAATARTPEAERLGAVNTLVQTPAGWRGHNTDEAGLRECLRAEGLLDHPGPVRIYGGGGTLAMLRTLFPAAACYALRTQALRPDSPPAPAAADPGGLFIWAAGPRDELPRFPVAPQIVLDLNYRQDSAARELALAHGARYIDGARMFRAQAEAQRLFWSQS